MHYKARTGSRTAARYLKFPKLIGHFPSLFNYATMAQVVAYLAVMQKVPSLKLGMAEFFRLKTFERGNEENH